MSYYNPYQSMHQQYMGQPYYQYYPHQESNGHLQGQDQHPQHQFLHQGSSQYDQFGSHSDNLGGFPKENDHSPSAGHFNNGDLYGVEESSFFDDSDLPNAHTPNQQPLSADAALSRQMQEQLNLGGFPGVPDSNFGPSAFGGANQGSIPQTPNGEMLMGGSNQPGIVPHSPTSASNMPTQVAPSRTVYLGNIPSDIEPNELLDYVRSGILENVKILPSKNCAFISFIDAQSALLFHSDCILKKLHIKGNDIRIGWGKNAPILPAVMEAIQRDGATRNVYLGNLNNPVTGEMITEAELREDLSSFGVIDCIKVIPDKGIAFIHFLSILSAIRCVANLPLKEKYLDKKCFYGKDRCAFITKTQQHNAAQYLGLAPGMEHVVTAADREFISSALVQQSAAAAQIATQAGGANNLGNRTVYLGNLHQESSVEEICNVVRGGLLQSIRFLSERHVCFITFIDPIAAAQFFAMCQLHGLTIHNRRIKVGWGKHSGPLSNALSLAVSNGASRNIYIGNITDFEYYNAKKLRKDFTKFGDIEQINYLEEKNCAFINFVNIANAIKAIDGIKSFDDYKKLKINFGKDRCGNLPRQFQNQQQVNSNINLPQFASSMTQPSDESTNSDSEFVDDNTKETSQ
ncbi:hypothetical protein FT663_01427 [Candidozyma haemuli var. vulneris]|uniref:RRM domain-containing protein n=1 Tax=Candidozyma haemuli TaxID=45357 RepID=A0A2V1AZR5_9ASCO|nr:hypothetical protein CXQ85_002731 [[Candida] haemuloni]KAF3992562.1 hypothetical protein FT662_01108 [[Candida] haemuloni var. vulneris]KAF3994514.1 hypothetical protein FT663_01427 [[Candida] haemuloni var. vulneris]PVH23006.1 hypothetical protein CXQ85_002731 [[Candida] haemuloni]